VSRAGPRVEIAPDPEALARRAAAEIAGRAAAARGRFAVALAGGSTPRRTYELLAGSPHRQAVPWGQVEIFFGDERCVPPDDPASNHRMAREALLDRVPIPPARIHRIRGEAPDAAAAAAEYEAVLRAALGAGARLDLVLLGMGQDGHVASLFPGSEALAETGRLVRAVLSPAPPVRRITLTLPALDAAAAALFLVAGAEKAERVAEVLSGRGPDLPAARVRPAGETLWLLDAAAASRLPGRGKPLA
jgi:6-phosphogluconolactonase